MRNELALNFALSAGFVTIAMLALWLLSLKIKNASIVDLFWGVGFAVIALLCIFQARNLVLTSVHFTTPDPSTAYLYLLGSLPIIWAIRYTIYITKRNWGHGEDKRYRIIRKNVSAKQWPLYSLRVVFLMQGLAMMVVATPIIIGIDRGTYLYVTESAEKMIEMGFNFFSLPLDLHITQIGALSIIGTMIWFIGFLIEAVGDFQLSRFIARRKKLGSEITGTVMDTGLWRYSRHPNYFGNCLIWWGIWLVACEAPWGWTAIVSPLLMTLALVKLTGAQHLERTLSKRPDYAEYMKRTPMFIPSLPKQ